MAKITFDNKVDITVKPIPDINKLTASNINEIKSSVNDLYDEKEEVLKVVEINTSTTKIISNLDDNTLFYLNSANITFDLPNGLDDIAFGVSVRGSNKPTYIFGANYTTDPSDPNDLDLIYNSSHYVRKIGTKIIFN